MTIGVSVALAGAAADGGSLSGTPVEVADRFRTFATLGIDQIQVVLAPSGAAGIEAFAEVLDLLDESPPAS